MVPWRQDLWKTEAALPFRDLSPLNHAEIIRTQNHQTLLIPFFHVFFCILHLDGFSMFFARLLDHEDGPSALGLLQGVDGWKSQMSYLDRKQAWALSAAGWWKHRQAAFLVPLLDILFLKSANDKDYKYDYEWRHLACHRSAEGDDWLCSWNFFLIVLQDSNIFWQPQASCIAQGNQRGKQDREHFECVCMSLS